MQMQCIIPLFLKDTRNLEQCKMYKTACSCNRAASISFPLSSKSSCKLHKYIVLINDKDLCWCRCRFNYFQQTLQLLSANKPMNILLMPQKWFTSTSSQVPNNEETRNIGIVGLSIYLFPMSTFIIFFFLL